MNPPRAFEPTSLIVPRYFTAEQAFAILREIANGIEEFNRQLARISVKHLAQ